MHFRVRCWEGFPNFSMGKPPLRQHVTRLPSCYAEKDARVSPRASCQGAGLWRAPSQRLRAERGSDKSQVRSFSRATGWWKAAEAQGAIPPSFLRVATSWWKRMGSSFRKMRLASGARQPPGDADKHPRTSALAPAYQRSGRSRFSVAWGDSRPSIPTTKNLSPLTVLRTCPLASEGGERQMGK